MTPEHLEALRKGLIVPEPTGRTLASLAGTLEDSTFARVQESGLRLTCRLIPRRAAPLVTNEQLQRAQMALITGANEPTKYGYPETTIFDDDASVVVAENAK